jgi:hypothetical protein
MSRLLSQAVGKIQVEVDSRHQPVIFVWSGKRHQIERIGDTWIFEDWVQEIRREYFKVITTTGYFLLLYHDSVNQQWFIERQYV